MQKKDIFPWERIATTYTISDVRNYWKCNYLFYVFSSNKCSTASNKLDLWIIILWWIISEQHFKTIMFSFIKHLFTNSTFISWSERAFLPASNCYLCVCHANRNRGANVWSDIGAVWCETNMHRADSRFATSQWEMTLLCNDISQWRSTSLESALMQAIAGACCRQGSRKT